MNGPRATILLVEDEPNDVFLIQRAFRKANIAAPIQVVHDGEMALSYLVGKGEFADRERFPFPQLVLLDLKLPRKTGLEVLAWMRTQSTALKRTPVVVLTSSKQSADINRAYELGANSYLAKPVAFEGLIKVVEVLDLYWLTLNEKPETP